MPIEVQVSVLFGMQHGLFNDIDPKNVVAASSSLKDFFVSRKYSLLTEIRTKAKLDDDIEAKLKTACDEWKSSYTA